MDITSSTSLNIQEDNIQVAVRIRPLNERERKQNARSILSIDQENPNKIWIESKPESKSYIFDCIINSDVQQDEIFEKIGKPQADFCLKGYNSSIFAYGQTGAGKTYTMLGKQGDHRGLQPRVFEYIFNELQKFENSRVKCSYLEIYNEQIMDLLSPSGSTLLVREDQKKGVYIEGLSEEKVTSAQQAIELLNTGARNRHVSATQMNIESSRSHSLFSLTIETKDKDNDGLEKIRCSKFHFVDLAGSERQNLTGAAGQTLKEASNINKSLTVLGCVINSLVEQNQGKQRHIPYRDSRLTFILKDSLGGNSKTFIIAAISDASISFQETLSTLKFAQRAKMIKNKAQLNEENNITDVKVLRLEIKQLKERLEQMREQELNFEKQLKSQMNEKESQDDETIIELKERLRKLNEDCLNNEKEFQKAIHILRQQQENEASKYENIIREMKDQISKQFTSDAQQQIIIHSQQVKLKMLLEKTFPNNYEQGKYDMQFLKDTENLLNDFEEETQFEKSTSGYTSPYDNAQTEQIIIEEQEYSQKDYQTPSSQKDCQSINQQKDQFFLICLNNLMGKIDQSIKSRKEFAEVLQKMGLEYEWNTPEKMRACEQSIDSLRQEYTSQIFNMQQQVQVLRDEKNLYQQEIDKLKTYIGSMEEEIDMKNRELNKMDEKYRELSQQMRQENKQRQSAQMIELVEKIIFLEEEKDKLIRESERQKQSIDMQKQENNSLYNQFQQVQQQFEVLQRKECISCEEIKVLKGQIKEHELRELSHQFKLSNMNNELQDFIEQNTQMLEEAQKWQCIEQTNDQLTKKLEDLQSENTKLADQVEILTESNQFIQNQLEEKSKQHTELERDLQEKENKMQELYKKNKNLQERYDQLQNSYDNIQIDSEENNEILEQNKSLFRRCDNYVVQIEKLTKERDQLQIQVTRKQEQASRFQLKISELQVSQKHLSGALRDAQEKLSQAQNRIQNIKVKAKYIKESEKWVAEAESKLLSKDIEIHYLNSIFQEKVQKCNNICLKINNILDENENLKDIINQLHNEIAKLNNDNFILQETNNRLCEANQNICREKVNILSKLSKYETENLDLSQKFKGLEQTFNNLMISYTALKGENSNLQMASIILNQQRQITAKLETELQIKNDKISDLQAYLDKYTNQIRSLEQDLASTKKELEQFKKQPQASSPQLKEHQVRIDELIAMIGSFEYHCGLASELLDKLEFEKQEQCVLIETFKTQIRAMSASIQLQQSNSFQSYGRKEIHYIEGKKYSKKAKKYKRKYQEALEKNDKLIMQYESQIIKLRINQDEFIQIQKQLEEKETISKKLQEINNELNSKLVMANKIVQQVQQTEYIQFQQVHTNI
ncbi:kinesin motor catalytic domain protein (macronuclear) [Tetrahymena thermophila SB210]|uniref:Kinesin motor catalytic domain protein n=1 Tax=Tetrahymena thermophila (strain SB210) TaxID=312017 RepID=I7MKG6_TETTS|nr:kinesin motor catalytic domain protein [Tetrahymena thermophila SB210]EAR98391.2 kinesin motor catalytic domain protein [Tetrahymena thermophila SB210]|eukprot:XP_001018636.2 kinesin motor catalytic domain protein [Tetrahymena thermophila SB210]